LLYIGTLSGNTSTPVHVSASHPHVVHIRVITEDSPLIARRRFRRQQRHDDSICNWKILSLFFILITGVYIGVHLLILECMCKTTQLTKIIFQKINYFLIFIKYCRQWTDSKSCISHD
jgi:hypothetical protein